MPTAREIAENTKAYVSRRKDGYCMSFNDKTPVESIEKASEKVFLGLAGTVVLQDLAEFCRATQSTFNPDQRLNDVLIGRHEVWLRIQNHLNLTTEELYRLHGGLDIRLVTQEEET
tara:strand:+ start:1171 stop:1518 length:348 start_codon:yes stop_codon:yes gene_type:complete